MRIRTFIIAFDTPHQLLASMLDDQPHGGLFHATTEDLSLGETVIADVRLPEIPEGVLLVGTVIWRRRPTAWRSSLVPGVGIAFHRESGPQRDFLARYASGTQTQKRRNGARCHLSIPVEVGLAGLPLRGLTADLGRGGIFVPSQAPVPVGQPVEVTLLRSELNDAEDRLDGDIVWTSVSSANAREPGFAVAFKFRSPLQRRRLEMLVGAREAEIYRRAGMPRQTMRW